MTKKITTANYENYKDSIFFIENNPKFELVTVKSLEYYHVFKSRLENWEKLNPMLEIAIRECATNEDYKDNVRAPRSEWRMHSHKKYG